MYKIKIIPRAQKDLDNFRGKTFEKIKKVILKLSVNPRPAGCIKLTNEEGCCNLANLKFFANSIEF